MSSKIIEMNVLINCSTGGNFIDQNYAWNNNIMQTPLEASEEPLPVFNVNGTPNKNGTIMHQVELDLKVGDKVQHETLLVSRLGRQKVILGFPWLQENNPDINWKNGHIWIPCMVDKQANGQ